METRSRLCGFLHSSGRRFDNALQNSVFHPAIAPLCQLLVHPCLKFKFLQPNWYEIKRAHWSGRSFFDCASALKVLLKSDREANFHAATQTRLSRDDSALCLWCGSRSGILPDLRGLRSKPFISIHKSKTEAPVQGDTHEESRPASPLVCNERRGRESEFWPARCLRRRGWERQSYSGSPGSWKRRCGAPVIPHGGLEINK